MKPIATSLPLGVEDGRVTSTVIVIAATHCAVHGPLPSVHNRQGRGRWMWVNGIHIVCSLATFSSTLNLCCLLSADGMTQLMALSQSRHRNLSKIRWFSRGKVLATLNRIWIALDYFHSKMICFRTAKY